MADNMTNIEQGKPQPQKVAERWLKIKGIEKPHEAQLVPENVGNSSIPLIQEAYDLFAEKQDLSQEIVRHQLSLTKPISKDTPEKERWNKTQEGYKKAGEELEKLLGAASDNLSFEEKRDLIRQGKIAKLTQIEQTNALIPAQKIAAIKQSQARIGEIDTGLEKIFATPGAYDKFVADLSHQVGVRHQAHEVNSLVRFEQEADLLALKLSREAQVDGRPLTSIEKRTIEENRTLKEEAGRRIAELISNPDVFDRLRMLELQNYRKELKHRFAVTPSRRKAMDQLERLISEGKKVLVSSVSGTGKTELIRRVSRELLGKEAYEVTGHKEMTPYELLGKTGFRLKQGEGGDIYRPSQLFLALGIEDREGGMFFYDEMDASPNEANIAIKTRMNDQPGTLVRVQMDSDRSFKAGNKYCFVGAANIKDEKHTTRFDLDPAIVRVLEPMNLDYMPPHEVYDLTLASMINKRGCIPLSEQDARTTLKNLCDAASWIQDAYQGRRIVTDTSKNTFLEARGQGSTGRVASLKKALLDPGRTIGMLKGWSGAQVRGESFEDYLNSRIVEFINNRAYPEDDRYYLTEIFALKGFLKGVQSDKLSVPGLTQAVLDRWSGGSNKNKQQLTQSEYLTVDRVVRLDPYKRFMRPVDLEAAEMLKETEVVKEGRKVPIPESSDFAEAKDIMGMEFFGPDEVENAFGFEIDKDLIPDIPFSAQELADAKANGQYLMLYISNKADGVPITARELANTLQEQFERDGKGKIQYNTDWYKNEKFYAADTPRIAWRLITKDVIPNSLNHNYLEQTEDIVKYLKGTIFKGRIPTDYQEAIAEFEKQKRGIEKNLSSNWQDSANKLAGLKLTQMTRQTFVEERYSWLVYFQNRNERLFEDKYNWTSSRTSNSNLVLVGKASAEGAYVPGWSWRPDSSADDLGVVFSR